MRTPLAALLVISVGLINEARAADIDIKGLHIGIPKAQVEAMYGPLPIREFTIADVPHKNKQLPIFFREDRLDSLYFYFDPEEFDHVLAAVTEKYSLMRCRDSTVVNALGGRFVQTECSLKGKDGILSLTRFNGSLESSALSLISHESLREAVEQTKARKKDI